MLAEVLNRAVKGLEAALGKRRDRAELSKREREHVEGWEGVMEEVERVCEVRFVLLPVSDDTDRLSHRSILTTTTRTARTR